MAAQQTTQCSWECIGNIMDHGESEAGPVAEQWTMERRREGAGACTQTMEGRGREAEEQADHAG